MCLSVMVGAGSSGTSIQVLGVGVLKCHELADFLSFREWP